MNALSTEFSLSTYRGDYYHTIELKNGAKVNDIKEKVKKNGKKHGTIVSFISNPYYLGAGSHLPIDKVKEWLELMSYQLNYNIEFHIEEWEGLKLVNKEKIKRKGFSDLIFHYIQNPKDLIVQPISLESSKKITEEVKKDVVD